MAKPQSKTTVSVLRSIIGIPARELAKLTGRSIHTIKSVESGRLALSEELALKMSIETGICAQWLVNGDPHAPPLNDLPLPPDHRDSVFTKGYFEKRRADREEGLDELNRSGGATMLDSARLWAINAAAVESGNGRLVRYRISKFLRELKNEFGQSDEVFREEMAEWDLWANYREFVPSFKRAHAKLTKERDPQAPDIVPLLQWTLKEIRAERAAQVITQEEEIGASRPKRRASKSPAWYRSGTTRCVSSGLL